MAKRKQHKTHNIILISAFAILLLIIMFFSLKSLDFGSGKAIQQNIFEMKEGQIKTYYLSGQKYTVELLRLHDGGLSKGKTAIFSVNGIMTKELAQYDTQNILGSEIKVLSFSTKTVRFTII